MRDGILGQWWRIGGACGIAFIVVLIASFVIQGEPPAYNDPIDEIRAYWQDDRDTFLVVDYLLGLASMLLLLPFMVTLRAMLGRAEGEPRVWSLVGLIGAIFMIVISVLSEASWRALAFGAADLGDDTVRALMFLDVAAWNAFPFAIGVWVLFSSLVIAQTGVLSRWLGWLGLIIAVAAFIAPLGILDEDPEDIFDVIGFIPFIGLVIWVVLTGIGMLMKAEEPTPVVTRAT